MWALSSFSCTLQKFKLNTFASFYLESYIEIYLSVCMYSEKEFMVMSSCIYTYIHGFISKNIHNQSFIRRYVKYNQCSLNHRNIYTINKLNKSYTTHVRYRLTKDKLLTMPKGRQFDFSETQIFQKFDLFCRRVIKLMVWIVF